MDYLKVLGVQLDVNLDCNSKDEYLLESDSFYAQMDYVKSLIEAKQPDVIALPEMCYVPSMQDYFQKLAQDKLIVAGSIYHDGINETAIFNQNGLVFVPKCNASGAEPMTRNIENISYDEFYKQKLDAHTFTIAGRKIVVLNCMEYYQNAHFIARNCPDIFGIVCVCSNNNPRVFMDESRVIHNHVENIYTFMINCVSTYQGKPYGKGQSYVYGPIQDHEKEWLLKEGIQMDNHPSAILQLGGSAEYFYGEFTNDFSRFGRSDSYINNPRGVEIGMIRKKVKK